MRVGYVQTNPLLRQIEANLDNVTRIIEEGPRADLLVLPELALTGYALPDRDTTRALAEEVPGPSTERLVDLARKVRTHLVVGVAERSGDKVYNSAVLLGPAGVVAVYRKTHLFWNEPDLFDPGNTGFQTFALGDVRVGMMVCFDWVFPESAGTLARRGAHVIAHPSNLVLPYAWKAMPARCLENRVFAVTANRYGEEPGPDGPLLFRGCSIIVSPTGEVLSQAPAEGDAIDVVEIDPGQALDKKLTPRNHLFDDRRKELYD